MECESVPGKERYAFRYLYEIRRFNVSHDAYHVDTLLILASLIPL